MNGKEKAAHIALECAVCLKADSSPDQRFQSNFTATFQDKLIQDPGWERKEAVIL